MIDSCLYPLPVMSSFPGSFLDPCLRVSSSVPRISPSRCASQAPWSTLRVELQTSRPQPRSSEGSVTEAVDGAAVEPCVELP